MFVVAAEEIEACWMSRFSTLGSPPSWSRQNLITRTQPSHHSSIEQAGREARFAPTTVWLLARLDHDRIKAASRQPAKHRVPSCSAVSSRHVGKLLLLRTAKPLEERGAFHVTSVGCSNSQTERDLNFDSSGVERQRGPRTEFAGAKQHEH